MARESMAADACAGPAARLDRHLASSRRGNGGGLRPALGAGAGHVHRLRRQPARGVRRRRPHQPWLRRRRERGGRRGWRRPRRQGISDVTTRKMMWSRNLPPATSFKPVRSAGQTPQLYFHVNHRPTPLRPRPSSSPVRARNGASSGPPLNIMSQSKLIIVFASRDD